MSLGGGIGWKVLPAQRITLDEVLEAGPEDWVGFGYARGGLRAPYEELSRGPVAANGSMPREQQAWGESSSTLRAGRACGARSQKAADSALWQCRLCCVVWEDSLGDRVSVQEQVVAQLCEVHTE